MGKEKDGNLLTEGKTLEKMNSGELEEFIAKGMETVPLNPDGSKQEATIEEKDEKTEEKKETDKEVKEKKEVTPELIDGKFKTTDELVKAYHESEKKISQLGEKSSKFEKLSSDYKQRLSDQYEFDEEGNLIGAKVRPTPQMQSQVDQLAGLRPYFPDYTDEQLMAHIGLNAIMIRSALGEFKTAYDNELRPIYEIRFEREVENQKKEIRGKYPDYADLEVEVDEKLARLPSELRSRKGCVETLFLTTRGEHAPDLIEKAKKGVLEETQKIEEKKEETFVESGGKSSVSTPPVNTAKMSSDELEKYINTHTRK
jgi:hypothetical protein